MPRTSNLAASPGYFSVSTFSTTALPGISTAVRATSGAAVRQGPHQSAQKSTSTGTGTSRMISSNKTSSTAKGSASGGNGDLHFPQRPVLARYFAGTRLCWPQWLHARTTGKDHPRYTNRCCSFGCRSSFRRFTVVNFILWDSSHELRTRRGS
jgi:hypothetical protein